MHFSAITIGSSRSCVSRQLRKLNEEKRGIMIRNRLTPLLAAAAIAALALTGCTTKSPTSAASGGDTANKAIKICVYTHGDGGTFWAVAQKGAEAAAKDLGVTLDYQGSSNDSAKQASTIQAGIAAGCKGIAASAPDPEAIKSALAAAEAKNIPVLTINSGSNVFTDLGAFTHVGQDELIAGEEAGKKFNELGLKKILCPIQEAANAGLVQRCQGAAKTFKGTVEQFNVDGALSDLSGAQAKILAALQADKSIDGVFALNADVATGAVIPAVKTVGRDIKVGTVDLSADALTAIKSGTLLFAIDQQQYAQGYLAVDLLYLTIKDAMPVGGGQPINTGPSFVTKDNVAAVEASVKAGTR
jgi:simple sugar transport system substrate-binding protein